MKKKTLLLAVIMMTGILVVPVSAQQQAVKKKINLNADNIKRATEILNRNKQFFSNPENLKAFNRIAEKTNKKKVLTPSQDKAVENATE